MTLVVVKILLKSHSRSFDITPLSMSMCTIRVHIDIVAKMVFSVVCCRWIEVYVCICHRDNPWTVWDIIMKFWCEQDMMSSRTAAFRGWWFPRLVRGWFNVSDVLVKFLLAFHCNYMCVYIVPFLRYSTSNNDSRRALGIRAKVIQDHWKWYHSTDSVYGFLFV